jgi:hypothetical protein
VRRPLLLVALALTLSACGGTGAPEQHADAPSGPVPRLATAVRRTTAAGSARFAQRTALALGGSSVQALANGTVSLRRRRGRIFKESPGGGVPGELVVLGPVEYSNANVEAALNDPTVRPWTRLDTRRLDKRERASQADDLAHAVAPAYLADGVSRPILVTTSAGRTEYRGRVDPTRLDSRLPPVVRSWVIQAVRADYPNRPFTARFWLDAKGRMRRVLVSYATRAGTPVSIDTRYSDFGAPLDLSLPPARDIKDISPTH